jgi:hypothetical protein
MKHHRLAGVILGLYLIIGLTHSIFNPIFESSDEWSHYPFVAHVARGQGLPVQEPGEETLWRHEGSQPPLYYLLMGALTSWIDTSDLEVIQTPNPHAQIGVPLAGNNKNMIVHTEREAWPWRGTVLAVHLVRFASLLMGAVAVACTYRLARVLVPDEPGIALFAMALHAFLPMYAFITASVNNDNLLYMLSAIALLLLFPAGRRPLSVRRLLLLGFVLGCAALTKLSGLVLLPVAGVAIVTGHVRAAGEPPLLQRTFRGSLRDGLIVAAPVVALASWWYIRNIALYGDITGLNVLLTFIEGRVHGASWTSLLTEFEGFRINFWGLFGGVNILMPNWTYRALDLVSLLAVVGLVVWVVFRIRGRRPVRWIELLLGGLYLVGLVVGVARFSLATPASQGRLIFPGLPVIMTLLALGLAGWAPRRARPALALPVAGLLFALAISAPFTVIRAAYAPPPIITESDIPKTAEPYHATFGGQVELVAFELGAEKVYGGDDLPVTLYWRALTPPSENYSVYIKVIGRHDRPLGEVDALSGRGTHPSGRWLPGQVIVDTFRVPVEADPSGPVAARIEAGLYRYANRENLPATDAQGQAITSSILKRFKVVPALKTPLTGPSQPLNVSFGGKTRLDGYDLSAEHQPGDTVTLALHWTVVETMDREYTVFVHLFNEDGQRVLQADSQPLDGTYPTSLWEPGEHLIDRHTLALPYGLPSGAYTIVVGLYGESDERLLVIDAAGAPAGDSAPPIPLEVKPR